MGQYKIEESDKSILAEIGSIGMGNASTALSQILNAKINVSLPEVDIIQLTDLNKYFNQEDVLLGLVLKLLGDIQGKIMYMFKRKDAYMLIDMVTSSGSLNPGAELTEDMKVSTIKEISNILSGSYLAALAKFASLNLVQSIPHLAMDTAASIFDLASMNDESATSFIFIKSKLSIANTQIEAVGYLIVVLKEDQLMRLLDIIRKKYSSE